MLNFGIGSFAMDVCIGTFCIDFMVNIVFGGLKGISKIVFQVIRVFII